MMRQAMKMMQGMDPNQLQDMMKNVTPEQMRQAQAMVRALCGRSPTCVFVLR